MSWWIRILRLCILTATVLATAFVVFSPLRQGLATVQASSTYNTYLPVQLKLASQATAATSSLNASLGAAFISSAEIAQQNSGTIPQTRYEAAANLGATWNRWPFYWWTIETSNDSFDYHLQDAVVNSDVANGLKIDGILMSTPCWASSASSGGCTTALEANSAPVVGQGPHYMGPVTPAGDGTGAALSTSTNPLIAPPNNLDTWIFDDGDTPGPNKQINQNNYWARFVYNTVSRYKGKVAAWEIWNEPDLLDNNGQPVFWSGTVAQYARLLKVAYIAAKYADPNAIVLMSGLSYWSQPNFLTQLLSTIKSYGEAAANNYYFDVSACHWYSRSSQMYDMVNVIRGTLQSYGLGDKPIWVNETGVPIWDDLTKKPFGWSTNQPYFASATQDETASYVIQSLAYGLAAGVQQIFDFQEYDDGNAEVFGLLRNDNSVRPSYAAYQVAAKYFTGFSSVKRITDGTVDKIIFGTNTRGQAITALWDNAPGGLTYNVPAATGAAQAYWVDKAGNLTNLALAKSYSIALPGATDNNGQTSTDYIIGGSPYLLVQQFPPDATPPTSQVNPLAPKLTTPFLVSWSGTDVGWGILSYDVDYKDGDGAWTPWIYGTSSTSAYFTGAVGHTYYFRSRARDVAGNVEAWPAGADTYTTVVQFPYKVILPIIFNNASGH